MKLKLLLLMIILLSLAGNAAALGVTPPEIVFDFEPPFSHDANLRIYNTEHRDMNLTIYVEGSLAKRVEGLPEIIALPADSDYIIVNYTLTIPPGIIVSGETDGKIIVSEVPPIGAESSIYSVISVAARITVLGQFPGKHVIASMTAEDSAGGDDEVIFKINAKNYGIDDIQKLTADIDIFTPSDQSVETIKIPAEKLESGESIELTASWLPEAGIGAYYTFANLFYDGQLLDLDDEFRVGTPYVKIDKAVAEKKLGKTILDFDTISNWNERMHNVHAEVLITDENDIIIDDLKTDFYVVEPFGENNINFTSNKINTDENLKVKLLVFYDNRNTLREYRLNDLISAKKWEFYKLIALIIGIIAALALLIFRFPNFGNYIKQNRIITAIMKEAKYGS